ncbi:MAG: c-type cytochrome biogenesis protein CcsB [Deltaproteobacteria bacterium]|nr:MAG: c-type cytochrome biogenesis protein CcsB [Deltaproteobacteria bacterium]
MENTFIFSVVTFIYGLSSVLYIAGSVFHSEKIVKAGFFFLVFGFAGNVTGFFLRWIESYRLGIGRIPLSNLYESLVFFAVSAAFLYIVFLKKNTYPTVGAIVSTIIFFAMAYAGISPNSDSAISPLVPALRSNWLTTHVMTCFFAYAAFAISFAVSLIIIFKAKEGVLERLEILNSQIILFGFLFLTLGIITGSVWANSAWGRYWSWDSKETWALITWLVYALVLHSRYMTEWSSKVTAWLSILGFLAVMFTYFGVNLILPGLHSYA